MSELAGEDGSASAKLLQKISTICSLAYITRCTWGSKSVSKRTGYMCAFLANLRHMFAVAQTHKSDEHTVLNIAISGSYD